jgi:hypothetical protein
MSETQARTAKATEARRLKFLTRKADEYAAALRELGYTVIPPLNTAQVEYEECGCIRNRAGAHRRACPLCDDYGLQERTAAYEEATDQCGCMREPLGHSRTECPSFVAPESEAMRARCLGCPDPEACSQGGCHLDGGPVRPS